MFGATIPQESSQDALPRALLTSTTSTTQSFFMAGILTAIGLSKTVGALIGGKMDS